MKKIIVNNIFYGGAVLLIWFLIKLTFYIVYPYCYSFEKKFDNYWWVRVFENPNLEYAELWVFYNQQLFFAILATLILFLSLIINHFIRNMILKTTIHYLFFVIFIPLWYMAILPAGDMENLKTNKEIVDFSNIILINLWMVIFLIFNYILLNYLVLKGLRNKLNKFWLNRNK